MFEKQWLFLEKAVGQLYSTAFEVVSGGHLEPHKAKTTEGLAGKLQAWWVFCCRTDEGRVVWWYDVKSHAYTGLIGR